MSKTVTIVMYHYVRDLERSRFPAIKGLSVERFRRQLDFIQANFTPIAMEDIFEAIHSEERILPPNPILLTFDDGYSDHFLNVFPLLDARGIRGCFFPPVRAVLEHIVLDVNKIQFVLAATSDAETLLNESLASLDDFRGKYTLKTRKEYLTADVEKHRYDPCEVVRLKRLLQRELPNEVRTGIIGRLFAKYVTSDEASFAQELYMSTDQIACLRRHGMEIGSHGYSHSWLTYVSRDEQVNEIERSLNFLAGVGIDRDRWTMCYPYGGYDVSLIDILRERRCRVGVSAQPRMANLDTDDPLTLPRIDANDLPS